MKTLFGLFFILFLSLRTMAQDVNPIYGLALCETDKAVAQQSTGFTEAGNKDVSVDEEANFREFLSRFEKGLNGFIKGDATLWKEHISPERRCVNYGWIWAYEKGWQQVGPRYDWASAKFKPSGAQAEIEYLSLAVSGELAYTASVERRNVHFAYTYKVEPITFRATHVFIKNGEWKILHRHADHLMDKTIPGSAQKK